MNRRFLYSAVTAVLFISTCQVLNLFSPFVSADTIYPSQFSTLTGYNQLEDDLTQWNIYHDQGYTKGALNQVNKQGDGTLKVTLMHGTQSYADIHAYRNLAAADAATLFSMDVSFLFNNEKPVQALEFTMNKWVNDVRWEWALQWQIVPDGTSLAATPETWRVWDGNSWQSLQIQQTLKTKKWHTLHLFGTIDNNLVHYIGFACDNVYNDMTQLTFSPVTSSGDKLAVGVQLDGNYREAAYPVYYKDINLHYQ